MQYINLIENNCEYRYFQDIFNCLEKFPDLKDIIMFSRKWDQNLITPENRRYITLVTSAEGHNYIPLEHKNPLCLGAFTHYYPKDIKGKSADAQMTDNNFLNLNNVYQLPLGDASFFIGNSDIPILDRKIDVSFVGQLDPYRRIDFYQAVKKYYDKIKNKFFHFYDGWNNGIGEQYSNVMSNTKIALVPCGSASLDTFRFFEATKAGCIVLTTGQNQYEFMKENKAIYIPKWDDLYLAIKTILADNNLIEKTHRETLSFWNTNLCPQAAANYIYGKIKDKI